MVDLHCHILPGIDDGASNIETSVRMCYVAAENGIQKIVATPHVTKLENLQKFVERRDEKIEELRYEIEKRSLHIEIYPGAEVYVGDDIFYADDLNKVTINNSKYILTEFTFGELSADRFLEYLDEIYSMGLTPIIAHPERYSFLQREYNLVNYLAQRDVLFQINADNLAGMGSREEFELAYAMAFNGVASVISSDAHSYHGRSNNMFEFINSFPPDIGMNNLDSMLNETPLAIINNERIPFTYKSPIRKRRRGF